MRSILLHSRSLAAMAVVTLVACQQPPDQASGHKLPASDSRRNSMEIGEIIGMAVDAQYNGILGWDFLAHSGSPVIWRTIGVENSSREGTIVAAVDGFVPQKVFDQLKDTPWDIMLSGNKFGAQKIDLTNTGCFGSASVGPDCGEKVARIEKSIELSGLSWKKMCESGEFPNVTEILRVERNQKHIFLRKMVSAGSGGVSVSLTLHMPLESYNNKVAEESAMCVAYFPQFNSVVQRAAKSYLEQGK